MVRRKKKKRKLNLIPSLPSFEITAKPETLRSIYAIGAGVLSLLFLLAPFQLGGDVGTFLFEKLKTLFGVGYYLVPITLLFLTIGLIRQKDETGVGTARAVGAGLLFFSGIGILSLTYTNAGGIIGNIIMIPFVSLFDPILGGLMLGAVAVVGTLLALDTPLSIGTLFSRDKKNKKDEEYEDAYDETDEEEEYEDEDEAEHGEEEAEEEEAEKPKRGLFGNKKEVEEELKPMSFALVDKEYNPPPLSLLEKDKGKPGVGDIKANANIIKRTLYNFGITVEMDEISIGPTVTRYALKPAEGVRLQKILALQNNLELALAASPVRIEAPIPGKSLVGIEVPNSKKATVGLATLLNEKAFTEDTRPLLAALGRDIAGTAHFANISKMPHVLIAGATGSGKSVSIHALITSLLYRNGPGTLRFIMVDPKRVELTMYDTIPHLLTPVITEPKKAILALKWAAKEMERRYDILQAHSVRDISSYHENILQRMSSEKSSVEGEEMLDQMPYILIVIDELADIMQAYPRELEAAIVRLAQMSRAVGIHLILSTQRPSVNVITGLIKANIPSRVALQVASQIDSRTILDSAGAEKLLGAGDMLYLSGEMSKPHRIQTAFISEEEVKKVVSYIKKYNEENLDEITLTGNANESPNAIFSSAFDEEEDEDELYGQAKQTVEEAGKASTSFLQRKLRIGYARAARLMDILEENGVVGPADGAKPREVFTDGEDYREEEYEDTNEEEEKSDDEVEKDET